MNMLNAQTQAKKRWNKEHYTQIKVHVHPETASAFKEKCRINGVSMASVLSQYMADYSLSKITKKSSVTDTGSRKKRKQIVVEITNLVSQIRDSEEQLLENMPENLRNSVNYEIAEDIISKLEEVLEQIGNIY